MEYLKKHSDNDDKNIRIYLVSEDLNTKENTKHKKYTSHTASHLSFS